MALISACACSSETPDFNRPVTVTKRSSRSRARSSLSKSDAIHRSTVPSRKSKVLGHHPDDGMTTAVDGQVRAHGRLRRRPDARATTSR